MNVRVYCADISSMVGHRAGWSGHSRGNVSSDGTVSGLAGGVTGELNPGIPAVPMEVRLE